MASSSSISPQYARISDIVKEPKTIPTPNLGLEKTPLSSLENAVIPLVPLLPKIQHYAYMAKQRCARIPADDLSRDQSASIILYTMEWESHEKSLYFVLNASLRSEDRRELKPWNLYLKLLISALKILPPRSQAIYRGVKRNLRERFPIRKEFIWWSFSSCTSKMQVLENEQFLGKTGERTMFTIDCKSGRSIRHHSWYSSEDEVLLLPGRQFEVESCLQPTTNFCLIQLKETMPFIELFEEHYSDVTYVPTWIYSRDHWDSNRTIRKSPKRIPIQPRRLKRM